MATGNRIARACRIILIAEIAGNKCGDLGIEYGSFVDGTGSPKEVIVNGIPATVYWELDQIDGTVLVMIDDTKNTIISVFAGMLGPDEVVSIAESLAVVDSVTRYIP